MLKIKDNVDLKELEKFGFNKRTAINYEYVREIEGKTAYRIYTTSRHKNIQIEVNKPVIIAHRLQDLLYDLIKADLVEKV